MGGKNECVQVQQFYAWYILVYYTATKNEACPSTKRVSASSTGHNRKTGPGCISYLRRNAFYTYFSVVTLEVLMSLLF